MSVSTEQKKNVNMRWLEGFPELSKFTANKFYKTLGPFIIGVEIPKHPGLDKYRPYYVFFPLWKENLKACLEVPLVLQEIKNPNNLQFWITYNSNSIDTDLAISQSRNMLDKVLMSNVKAEDLFDLIDQQFEDILVRTSSAAQAKLFEMKAKTFTYLSDKVGFDDLLSQIENAHSKWDMRLFNIRYGNYESWFQFLKDSFRDRDKMLENIVRNQRDKKVANLQVGNLVGQLG